jgi:hypothetical protein
MAQIRKQSASLLQLKLRDPELNLFLLTSNTNADAKE